jgi:DNA polymerase-1
MKKERVAVIDADIILYKACRVGEEQVDWGNDQWMLWSDLAKVKTVINDQISLIVDEMKADRTVLCFSDKKNYRKVINPDYKANRRGGRKPLCFLEALQYCKDTYPFRVLPSLEADDLIGIIATTESDKNDYVVVSEDKDLLTIPGLHWNLKTKKLHSLSEKEADFNFFAQTLAGDTVDNYRGCPKVGKVTAEKILRSAEAKGEDLWQTVVNKYLKAGLTEDDAILNARMARILRKCDYNRSTEAIKLWKEEKKNE